MSEKTTGVTPATRLSEPLALAAPAIPQGPTLYVIGREDGTQTVYLVVGWNPATGNPLVVPLDVPSQQGWIELATGKGQWVFTTVLPLPGRGL